MEINFNNVRKQAIYSYERLVEKLNSSLIKEQQWAKPNDVKWEVDITGYVLVDAEDIQECVDDLRRLIGAIAMTYEPDDEKFKDVYSEVYPKLDQSMPCFNEEAEEEVS
jgi:hypothetical protein